MTKPTLLLALAAAATLTAATADVAEARPRPRAGRKFVANKTFGIGIMLGAPTGLSGKWFYGRSTAFDFGVGVFRRWRDHDGLHLHVDHLWHPVSITANASFELPLYVGLGARVLDFDNDGGTAFGIRAPLGVAFDFNNVPLDIFIELALVVDTFVDRDDDYDADLNGAIGFRYWF
jgi:hypothetical protein